jgi:hypothetical protein
MSWTFVVRPSEMELFRSCHRAWDFAARVRHNYVPVVPADVFDFDTAMHSGLAAYYLPAMDDWNRSIVRPLAIEAFQRAMREYRSSYEAVAPLTDEQEREWEQHRRLGEIVLNRYFDWAAPNDDFDSVLADEDLWVPIPDPSNPGRELGTLDQRPVRAFIRVEQLISDSNDEYWVVDHRIVWDKWEDDETLVADPVGPRAQWAVEVAYPQLLIAGTVYNQLLVRRDEVTSPASFVGDPAGDGLDRRDLTRGARHVNTRRSPISTVPKEREVLLPGYSPDLQELSAPRSDDIDLLWDRAGNDHVRRTFIRRSRARVSRIGVDMVRDVLDVRRDDVSTSPNPSEPKCSRCAFRKPCGMLDAGLDIDPVMAAEYRKRTDEEFDEDGLRWSPVRRGHRASLNGADDKITNARFRWG